MSSSFFVFFLFFYLIFLFVLCSRATCARRNCTCVARRRITIVNLERRRRNSVVLIASRHPVTRQPLSLLIANLCFQFAYLKHAPSYIASAETLFVLFRFSFAFYRFNFCLVTFCLPILRKRIYMPRPRALPAFYFLLFFSVYRLPDFICCLSFPLFLVVSHGRMSLVLSSSASS